MQKTNTNKNLVINDQLNSLIDIINIMKTELNLTLTIVIILCELIYDIKLYKQVTKKNASTRT